MQSMTVLQMLFHCASFSQFLKICKRNLWNKQKNSVWHLNIGGWALTCQWRAIDTVSGTEKVIHLSSCEMWAQEGCTRVGCTLSVVYSLQFSSSQMDPTQDLWGRNNLLHPLCVLQTEDVMANLHGLLSMIFSTVQQFVSIWNPLPTVSPVALGHMGPFVLWAHC